MPRIQWTNLPPALREHLFDRLRERKITVEDLYAAGGIADAVKSVVRDRTTAASRG